MNNYEVILLSKNADDSIKSISVQADVYELEANTGTYHFFLNKEKVASFNQNFITGVIKKNPES